MPFTIQVGNPTILYPETNPVPDLAYAIEELFPLHTEEAILYWNGIPVRIGYKYELSTLIEELLPLLSALLYTNQGKYKVAWADPSFSAYWFLAWDEHQLTIEAEWHGVAGNIEALLNNHNCVRTSKDAFLREWKGVLRKLIEAIHLTGIEIEAAEELEELERVYADICSFGALYQPQERVAFLPNAEWFLYAKGQPPFSSSASLTQDLNGSLPNGPEDIASTAVLGQLATV